MLESRRCNAAAYSSLHFNFRAQRIAADAAAAAHMDDPSLLLQAKAKRYAAMSSGGGDAVGDADQFLVDFEQKRYDDDVAEREVDALALAASNDAHCQLRSELEQHTANQSMQAAAARKQRDAALQVRLRVIIACLSSDNPFAGTPCKTCCFERSRQIKCT
jgi:hypothetical protein